jgi:hypothetical protein
MVRSDSLQSSILSSIAVGVVVQVVVSLAIYAWARWVARRQGGRGWRIASSMPLVALVLSVTGLAWSVTLLSRAFEATAAVNAADRATYLSEGIAVAMRVAAIFALPSWGLYLGSLVTSFVGSVRRLRDTDPALRKDR